MAKLRLKAPRDLDEFASVIAGKRPSSSAGFTVYADLAGNLVMRIRSHRQYGQNTDLRRQAQEWLFYVLLMWALLDAYFKRQFQEMSRGLWIMPRDIFIAVLTGKLFSFTVDGFTYYPIRLIMAVSDSLDAISQLPGALLYRALDRWRGLSAGPTGAYLRVLPNGLPGWDATPIPAGPGLFQVRGGGELTGPQQGSGSLTISISRVGIILPNLTTNGVSASFSVPVGSYTCVIRAYLYSYSTSGGNLYMRLDGEVFSGSGGKVFEVFRQVTPAQPAPGSNGVVAFPGFAVSAVEEGMTLHVRVSREGGHAQDTSSSPVALWMVTATFSSP